VNAGRRIARKYKNVFMGWCIFIGEDKEER
jgi:hypothetical protein